MMSMTIMFPSLAALRIRVPVSSFPAATRSSGVSIPWSTELRTQCMIGSRRSSTTVLSNSVSSPSITRLTLRPRSRLKSRTTRGKRLKIVPIGTIRIFMTPSCNSLEMRPKFCVVERYFADDTLKSFSKESNQPESSPASSAILWRISLTETPFLRSSRYFTILSWFLRCFSLKEAFNAESLT